MRIFKYIRVSGLGQVDKDGPVRQRETIDGFATRHELTAVAEFFEEGVSGTIEGMDRPKFAEMIAKIDLLKHEPSLAVTAIVVESMDRLARDLMVSEFLLRECRKRAIAVFCAASGDLIDVATNEGDPTRKMFRQILGALAEWEKSCTVRKLRTARLRMRTAGHRCEGSKPYGDKPGEREIKYRIARLRSDGDSYSEIAFKLNTEGSRLRCGNQWTKSAVRDVATGRKLKK